MTGATSGIGLSAAKHLASLGFYVFAGCRKSSDHERLRGFGLHPVTLDVSKSGDIVDFVSLIESSSKLPPLVAVINNAGTTTKRPLEVLESSELRRIFDVNFFGAFELTKRLIPILRRSESGARVVFVGSVSGIISLQTNGAYSTSKYALESLADTFRRELKPWGIGVSMVNPGYINTRFRKLGQESIKSETLEGEQQELYGKLFEKMQKKIAKRPQYAAVCCAGTDEAIAHALQSTAPSTRYYPAIALPGVPAKFAAPVIRFLSVLPVFDKLVDRILELL